ncbi:diguanylate cyclase (GGDEF) domain-containing protein [Mariprofundus ferrinatatus]|uniref:diguanylate cyclase n=1 Tax=Mariprofundus ferrinatatus TaxID=1921087 RepID=A0A2K8L2G7_9PROT|nr:diguanylate cyclase [Mariprofundus ferrinatatus]ATX81515.1 diguanylate cyclase (GGDEF) domain-containing protein [Mariprofundus ferrinatatus]
MIKGFSIVTKVNLVILIVLAIAAALVFFLANKYEQQHVNEMLHHEAEGFFKQLQIARHWNARQGGVYVFKRPGMEANPHLYKTGPSSGKGPVIEPEITDSKGRKLILKNPAWMAREISELSRSEHGIIYHLTSLTPINPDNAPDEFERMALKSFEAGDSEAHKLYKNGSAPFFRYMAPLKTEESCLACHGFQGHKVGDVRGGISVEIPIQSYLAHIEQQQIRLAGYILGIYILIAFSLTFTVRHIVSNPMKKIIEFTKGLEIESEELLPNKLDDEIGILGRSLSETRKRIQRQQMALREKAEELDLSRRTDPLTGANNRQHFLLEMPKIIARANRENSPTSILMVDIDHFKEINDHYGHSIGDKVLQQMVEHMLHETRSYDMLVRYGGEEFLVVMPNTENNDAAVIAERIRNSMESCQCVTAGDKTISYTVSIGVYTTLQEEIDQMLIKVDDAMYKAKEEGRNRVYNAL